MRKIINLLLVLTIISFSACKKKDENKTTSEQLLTGQTWNANVAAGGVFINGQKAFGVPLTATFTANALNSQILPTGTMKINGQTIPATWYMNADGTQLTIAYPNGTGIPTVSSTGLTGVSTTTFTTTLTAQQFVIKNTTTSAVQIFGLISIPANGELRFSVDGATVATPKTDNNLTAKTWTGSTAVNSASGLYSTINTAGVVTEVSKLATNTDTWEIKFNTTFGFNTLSVSGIPTPVTWSLNDAGNQITFIYPNAQGAITTTTVNATISATQLIIDVPSGQKLDMGLLKVEAGVRLKMAPKP